MRRALTAIGTALLLTGCGADPVVVGSKQNAENRLAAELCAQLLEDAGISVERRIGLGDSPETFSALRAGLIDLYPEYTGTALGLLGAPATADAGMALSTARAGFAPLGLVFLEPLGYQSNYVVVVRRDLAERNDLATVSDLAAVAPRLRLGATQAFADRPVDGLEPFVDHFGLVFEAVEILADSTRGDLYDGLIDGDLDVIIAFSTDPEVGDYGLVPLHAERPFFPAYEAVPLVARSALTREPRIASVLEQLAGRISPAVIRGLVRQAQVYGRSTETVASEALADLGLTKRGTRTQLPSFRIAASRATAESTAAARVLRAVREAVPGREVALLPTDDSLAAISDRSARVALLPGMALFDFTAEAVVRSDAFECIAVTGTSYVHVVTTVSGPVRLADANSIATGPRGSTSWKLAVFVASLADRPVEVVPLADATALAAGKALLDGQADAALLVASRGRSDVTDTLNGPGELRLIDAADWWLGPARLALPFLRQAILPAGTYPGQSQAVSTVAMQTVLVGPAPTDRVIGVMGPSTFAKALNPLADATVIAINTALGAMPDPSPHLRAARALEPTMPVPVDARTPSRPDEAILAIVIIGFLIWCGWLYWRSP